MRKIIVSIILSLTLAMPLQATEWFTNPSNGHLYTIIAADTWEIGEAQAVSLGGHLVAINSLEENFWVLNTVLIPTGKPYAWIGLYQIPGSEEPSAGWVWSSDEPVTFTNWNIDEPNDYQPAGGGENWAEMHTSGLWNDNKPDSYWWSQDAIVEVVPEPSCALVLFCGVGTLVGILRLKRR